MLPELRVRDLATIADVTLDLGPGLNVLTGETGAGKSMLVDALALLLGERAVSGSVRPGAAKAIVEGAFEGLDARTRRQVEVLGGSPGHGNRRIGYLPQRRAFDAGTRVRGVDVVRLGWDGDRWGTPLPFRRIFAVAHQVAA